MRRTCRVIALLLTAFSGVAPASADDSAPSTKDSVCGFDIDGIPGFTAAEVVERPKPRYPRDALANWSEGWVLLEQSVAADGSVRDLKVVDALGPKDFVDASVKAVARWRYKPATRNGAPVDQFLRQSSVLYLIEGSGREADHMQFVRKYNGARKLVQDKKYDEAIALLEEAFKPRLNLYEEAMGSFVLALVYAEKRDWQRALFHIRHASIEDGVYLEKVIRVPALALQVEIEARTGSYAEALCAFEQLRSIDPPSAAGESEAAKIVARINAALKDPKPLATIAQLATHPLFDAPAVWRHRLLRSKFSFAEIKGDVKSFRLACVGAEHDAAMDPEMQWSVPVKAGPCILRVDGAPGATFNLVEEW